MVPKRHAAMRRKQRTWRPSAVAAEGADGGRREDSCARDTTSRSLRVRYLCVCVSVRVLALRCKGDSCARDTTRVAQGAVPQHV